MERREPRETALNIYEAKVVRINKTEGDEQETELAISYDLNEKEQEVLENYIHMRDLEDSTAKKT